MARVWCVFVSLCVCVCVCLLCCITTIVAAQSLLPVPPPFTDVVSHHPSYHPPYKHFLARITDRFDNCTGVSVFVCVRVCHCVSYKLELYVSCCMCVLKWICSWYVWFGVVCMCVCVCVVVWVAQDPNGGKLGYLWRASAPISSCGCTIGALRDSCVSWCGCTNCWVKELLSHVRNVCVNDVLQHYHALFLSGGMWYVCVCFCCCWCGFVFCCY